MIFAVLGTRPEVVKMAPVISALQRRNLPVKVVGTGQHYNWKMMGSFLSPSVSTSITSSRWRIAT